MPWLRMKMKPNESAQRRTSWWKTKEQHHKNVPMHSGWSVFSLLKWIFEAKRLLKRLFRQKQSSLHWAQADRKYWAKCAGFTWHCPCRESTIFELFFSAMCSRERESSVGQHFLNQCRMIFTHQYRVYSLFFPFGITSWNNGSRRKKIITSSSSQINKRVNEKQRWFISTLWTHTHRINCTISGSCSRYLNGDGIDQ